MRPSVGGTPDSCASATRVGDVRRPGNRATVRSSSARARPGGPVQGDGAAGEVAPGDVRPARGPDPLRERGLRGPGPDRLGEVQVGLGVARHRTGDRRQRVLEDDVVVGRAVGRPGRRAELAHHEPAAGAGHAGQLGQRGVRVGDVAQAERDRHRVERGVGEGQREGVGGDLGDGAVGAGTQHAQREVRGHAPGARPGQRDRRHRRPRREVEHPLAGPQVERRAGQRAPAPVLAGGEHGVGEVVAARDPVEHRGDVVRVLVEVGAAHRSPSLTLGRCFARAAVTLVRSQARSRVRG